MTPVVLHVLEAVSSGTSRHVVDLVQHVGEVEHHVALPPRRSVGVSDDTAVARLREAGAQVHVVDMRRLPVHPVNVVAELRLHALARRVRPHVVHGHSAIGGALARALPGRAARVYTPHGFPQGRASLAVERALGRRTDVLVAVSASEQAFALEHALVPAARCVVIPNGVPLDGARTPGRLRSLAGVPAGAPLVGSVGRLDPQKAPHDLLATWRAVAAQHPEAWFVLVGDGTLRAGVQAAARDLPRFVLLPHVDEVRSAVGDLDVFVLLSRYEGGPYVALEAALGGVPLVLTDVVGNRDVVDEGSGVLVPFGDPGRAAAAVLDLLADPRHAASLAAAMRSRLVDRFDVRHQAAKHAELYHALAGR